MLVQFRVFLIVLIVRNIDKVYRLEFPHYLSTQNCRKGFIVVFLQ